MNQVTAFLTQNALSTGSRILNVPSGLVCIHPTISWATFNWAMPHVTESQNPKAVLDDLSEVLRAHSRRPCFLQPVSGDTCTLSILLRSLGLKPQDDIHHVYGQAVGQMRAFDETCPTGLVVKRTPQAADWLALLLQGFEVPPQIYAQFYKAHDQILRGDPRAHLYEVTHNGTRIGASMLWIAEGIDCLTVASVLPEHRGKGAHRALFAQRLIDSAEASVRWVFTETAQEPVRKTAERLGLERVMQFVYWH